MNALTNLLTKLPPTVRLVIYAVVSLATAGYSIWKATNGDIGQVIVGLIGALTSSLAAANVDTSQPADQTATPES